MPFKFDSLSSEFNPYTFKLTRVSLLRSEIGIYFEHGRHPVRRWLGTEEEARELVKLLNAAYQGAYMDGYSAGFAEGKHDANQS